MKLITQKCPACGANLEIEEGRDFSYCQYCGSKILIDSEKKEYTINKNINKNINNAFNLFFNFISFLLMLNFKYKSHNHYNIFILIVK